MTEAGMMYDRVMTAEEIEAIQNLEWEWFPMIAIGLEEIGELIAAATGPIAEEVQRLKKRVAELEERIRDDRNGRATYYREIDRRLVELEPTPEDRPDEQ